MPDYYVVNNDPVITADNPKQAARSFALNQRIDGGTVKVAAIVKVFDVRRVPGGVEVEVTER